MKKLALAAVAAFVAAAPMATATSAHALTQRGDRDSDRYDRDPDRGDRWDRDRDRGDWRDRRGGRQGYRDWDHRAHNGYYYRNRWYYGPPPSAYYGRPDFRVGYRSWRRGERLPPYYRSRYIVVRDYDRYRLRRPPRGYHWVRDDRGDYLLVGLATGIILSAILNSDHDRYDRYDRY
jgi:Ni/Co efflux regulator RcnB